MALHKEHNVLVSLHPLLEGGVNLDVNHMGTDDIDVVVDDSDANEDVGISNENEDEEDDTPIIRGEPLLFH